MKREIIATADGSVTIFLEEWNEHYHSKHGAIAEARHVFIQAGLSHVLKEHKQDSIAILELGFGTGLNALLSWNFAKRHKINIQYTAVEAFPVKEKELQAINYAACLKLPQEDFNKIHDVPWEFNCKLSPNFWLLKQQKQFESIKIQEAFNLIYFDCFGPRVQPELWTTPRFKAMYKALKPGGYLATYSAKGAVRRSMQEVGFTVERLPGPPGKREMLRARKEP